jgi:hypothetical protein
VFDLGDAPPSTPCERVEAEQQALVDAAVLLAAELEAQSARLKALRRLVGDRPRPPSAPAARGPAFLDFARVAGALLLLATRWLSAH